VIDFHISHDRHVEPVGIATRPDAGRQSSSPASPSPFGWLVVPELIGIALRVAVWSGIFCLLLFGLFTYAAPVVGTFLLIVLSARYVRRMRH